MIDAAKAVSRSCATPNEEAILTFRSPLWLLAALPLILSCDLRTVSSSIENFDGSAYAISKSGSQGRLFLRMPWPADAGESEISLPDFASETPPGQSSSNWREQVTIVPSGSWGESMEYWYSWFLLHLFAIDRQNLPDPNSTRRLGVEQMFATATRDPSTGENDRFTRYFPPEYAEALGNALSGTSTYMRFGFFLRVLPTDTPTIGSVVRGAPADLAGLERDDRILSVDGLLLDSVIAHLDNERPTRHSFRIFRPSTGTVLPIDITTAEVVYPTVWVDSLPGGVGYIGITQFVSEDGAETDALFRDALGEMDALRRNKDAWILDLRGNGGGTIVSSQGVAGALLGPNKPLVRVQERDVDEEYMRGVTKDSILRSPDLVSLLPAGRIVFLQDGGTASASEILLSSLRENMRSRLVTYGERSYGKGIGQLYLQTPGGAFVAVTCMHIDPVDSARYHHVGIPADIEIASESALVRALSDIRSTTNAGRAVVSARGAAGISLSDRWNRFERRAQGIRPLKPSSIPGSLGIW